MFGKVLNTQKLKNSFSENLLSLFKIRNAEAYLKPSQTSTMERFFENNDRLSAVNYFYKKVPSQIFDWVLNTPLRNGVK